MPSFYKLCAALVAIPLVSAQTYTTCNPLEKTCPADAGSTESHLSFDFTQDSDLKQWTTTAGTVTSGSNGAEFTLNKQGDAPTIESEFYIFFGEISVTMKAAPGTGIVSSIVFESDDLDEIDWEALGGDFTQIETNYFGKGDTTTYDRATWPSVSTPQDTWHTYKVSWQKDAITWYVDGAAVRTLLYDDASKGTRFPQTPMRIRLGIWAGGDPTNGEGTIEWAGGETDYSKAPFTMYVKSVDIVNSNPASSYTWSGNSGSYDSIQFTGADAVSSSSTSTTSKTSTSTLATTTQASTASRTSFGSTTSSSDSASTGSSSSATDSSPGSSITSATSPVSGFSSSSSSSSESSSDTTATAPSATPTFNSAVTLATNNIGLLSLLALVTALIQL